MFINGSLAGELDLSMSDAAGNVTAIGSWFVASEIVGKATSLEDFIVWALQRNFGPTDGTIVHDPDDNTIAVHNSGVTLANAVFEARFHNPYPTTEGIWSSGFLFRNSKFDEFQLVVITGNGNWYQYLRSGDVATQQLRGESFVDIDTSPSGSNHLRVIMLEDEGWFFINGNLAGELDLSMWDKAGAIMAIGSWFSGSEIAGKATSFEDFNVWLLSR